LPATAKEGDLFFDTTNNQLYVWHNGAWTQAQAVAASSAPDAVRFVTTLPALPKPAYPAGTIVLNKADDKLWQNVAGVWTEVPLQPNIAAHSITAGMIAAGAIGASEANIASLWAGLIATNKIQAGQIAAGAIGASEIAAGAISADKLAANQVLIGAAQIADGSITTLKIGGHAVIVPAGFTQQSWLTASTTLTEIAKVTFTLPYAGAVIANLSLQINYGGAPDEWLAQLYIDGALAGGAYGSAAAHQTSAACGGYVQLAAGTHTVSASFRSTNTANAPGFITLYAMAAMR
jgi:hypothetical protein